MTGLVIRAVAIGVLSYLFVQLLAQTNLYATSAVVLVAVALAAIGLVRAASRMTQVAVSEALGDGAATPPRAAATTPGALARDLDHAHALLDTVPAALIVLDAERVVFMNRAARALARENVATLQDIAALGASAPRLETMRPGAREVVPFADGSAAYVSCALFSTPDAPARRLLAVQRVAGDLDAVEVRAWGDMARVLAHEIMNSLTPIASLSESLEQLMQGRDADAEIIAALEVIKRRSQGLMSFVERYRTVAELPAPTAALVDVKPFLDGIERLMSTTFRERGIAYASQVLPNGAFASVDRELLEQALINLLRNAVEAVEGIPSPRIEIVCNQSVTQIAFEVRDNGRGLPDVEPAKLLTPFFSTKPGGGGIGLSVARHVALAHGGQLNMRRRATGGAEFSLVLPVG
ncbi:MAG TPA: PAS domain-containing sensor histidine kinase [Steroidobacteraceae bacterium]|nr:PAS domain-containing sensor histidine kinase [Steroidobacteraceae bacterium]